MIVTEEEAKTKRCQETYAALGAFTSSGAKVPALSVSYGAGAGFAIDTAPTHCIGAACMAWRQRWRIVDSDGNPRNDMVFEKEPKHLTEGLSAQAIGYCGKAGKP